MWSSEAEAVWAVRVETRVPLSLHKVRNVALNKRYIPSDFLLAAIIYEGV